ncbi:clathrin interactor EPSIN 2-like [Chenopodium quinoa]|uniref:clathrin interactor EPSIN 2-like n=1 Tax=Chenopodium quinoa TaxID=63459 RepID=UPI000B7861AF|nr:clathrin interactor EPSIN 2-like [Chenopodium quinoa]
MSMKKAFGQTIRDLKREVNKKVLKVPSIEQKVLDATSNEPWGPHGSLLADIALATRNYHEYQMIMTVLWRRLNDTGKNWRHVYKALTVLEYLVAHGSERVIDEIREHAYQISTLSDFQYIDSSGRDQGNNVRRKSQSLVQLVNDKERIIEVRQKAASNRDKFRSTSAVGGMYRPGSDGYGDDRYEGQDERNGYGREREWGSRDDERYGRYGDSYSREGDRYGRDSEENYGRERYGDDESRGRARSDDDYQYGSRGRSSDRDGDRAYDDEDRHSARGSTGKAEDHNDGRPIERKFSEQNIGAPPSYEEAVGVTRSPTYNDRDEEAPAASTHQSSPPTVNATQSSSPVANAAPQSSSPANNVNPSQINPENGVQSHHNMEADTFDEFDPRGSISAAPTTSNTVEMDLFGSLSDAFAPSPLAIMPAPSDVSDFQSGSGNTASNPSFIAPSGTNVPNQSFEDPFGDSPFKAIPSAEAPTQFQNFASPSPFQPAVNPSEHPHPAAQKVETPNLEFADTFSGLAFDPSTVTNVQTPPNQQFLAQEPQSMHDNDILAGILPPSGPLPPPASVGSYPTSSGMHPATASQAAFPPTSHYSAGTGFMTQAGPFSQVPAQNSGVPPSHHYSHPYPAPPTAMSSNLAPQTPAGALSHNNNNNNNFMGDFLPQSGANISSSSQSAPSSSANALALVPQQPAKKFEPKSAVWADTLSKGLVNLNISGPSINPLSDIGIDFESLNRKEKRMEKPSATPATSNVTMGKAMGSGSGMGRAGGGGLRPSPNPMMGPGMGVGPGAGMGGGPGVGMGMGSYGSINQQPMGMGGVGMGAGMNMGMGQGMQQPNGLAPGSNMNNYNPMMGRGGYPQQPYGGAYR